MRTKTILGALACSVMLISTPQVNAQEATSTIAAQDNQQDQIAETYEKLSPEAEQEVLKYITDNNDPDENPKNSKRPTPSTNC